MPELFDKPQKEKFNYPGVFDRSVKKPEVVVVTSDEKHQEEDVVAKKVRAPRKPKEATAEVSSAGTGRKSLKLGKIKG
jgi:hypothetical protein